MNNSNSNSVLSSHVGIVTYGVARSTLIHSLTKKKYIPVEDQIALISYKLLVWNKELLQFKIQGHTITRFNKEYIVIWVSPDTRGEFLSASLSSEYFLSFREPAPEYALCNYVLVWRKY